MRKSSIPARFLARANAWLSERTLIVNTGPAIRFAHSAFSVANATAFKFTTKSLPFLRSMIVTLREAQSIRLALIPSTSPRRIPTRTDVTAARTKTETLQRDGFQHQRGAGSEFA